jgi:hypothetical protein
LELVSSEDKVLLMIMNDPSNYIKAKVVSNETLGNVTNTLINATLSSIRSGIVLEEYNISPSMYQNINKLVEVENVVLSKEEMEDNMVAVSIMQIITMPLFMLIIFLVQMIGAEVNEEKTTKSMEIISDLTSYANENICKDLLTIVDTLELELKHNYNERFELLYNSILSILNKYGVTQIYPDKERPMVFHGDTDNAVTALPTNDSIADNTIVDVIKKGYMYKDKVLRYEDVIIYKYSE